MFTNSIEYYDRIYSEFKDYAAEAKQIDEFLKDISPMAKTILDVGCGTGEHARILTEEYGYRVDGIDLEPGFVEIAQKKCPGGTFSLADMTDFDLTKQYDVVTCLFSAIGYVRTVENTAKALGAFSRHLRPGGVMVVEPWISPDQFNDGHYHLQSVDQENLKVARISYSEVVGKISRITFEYLIGVDGRISRESEVHELGLLSFDELAGCFKENGLKFDYDEEGLSGRGLFIAQKL